MICSAVIVLMGILSLAGALGGDAGYPGSAPYYQDSGYASFGGDFYSYVNNNAAEAASATRTTANNVRELCELLKNVFGISMMGFGLLGVCHFGILRCDCIEKEKNAAESEPVATPETDAEPEAPVDPVV